MGTNSSTQQWVFLRLPNNAPQNHYAIQRDGTEPRQILPPHDLTIKHRVSVLGKSYGREIKIKKSWLTGVLFRLTLQSWAWAPVSLTVANTTRTFEKSAAKLSSTLTPLGKIRSSCLGKTGKKK